VATVRTPPPRVLRVAGCDLGKASASFAIGEVDAQGVLQLHSSDTVMHGGKPLEVFSEWYRREGVASCVALGVTGVHADRVGAPAVTGLPEDACLQAALGQPGVPKGSLNAISIGARGYAVLSRNRDGRFQYLENDKCSSGTGETMVKVAARFGLTLAEADRLASAAQELIPITARCSVFAKSEMTHFANQGRPTDALFRGYFGSIATYVTALLARVKVDGPVLVLGGGARIEALVTALRELLGDALVLPDDPQQFEARGALFLAAEQARAEALPPLPPDPTALAHRKETRIVTLEPASSWSHQVRRLAAPSVDPKAASRPSVLGIDLGSTGSKAALVSLSDGQMVLDAYDRTRGNPVDATRRLIEALLSQAAPDVRAVGLTGSGREAAATVLRATWPHLEDRIVVLNEIVAHGTAAIRLDEDDGESLSVVEIGGQDAKFIQIVGGQIVESDLNKACSAGTGSFLEEQAVFYGVHDIEEFTELAQRATRPPELGQMCTVFVADAATAAHGEGYGIPDLFGGFQYSVIHNYMHRVMGQRTFGKRIFFQGKPATGPSLPWTLAAVTGREVVVPPNPGAMGAWGIGLCTLEALGAEVLEDAPPIDLSAVVDAEVVGRSEFQCRDRRCATLCAIERTVVAVGDKRETVLSGGACPKYEISTAVRPRLPKEAPSAFAERDALLAPFLEHLRGEQVVGVPLVGACTGVLPWLVTFVHELGFGVRVLRPDAGALSRGEERCYSYDACAPAKIAHGVVDAEVERVFFPKLLSLGDRDGSGGSTCPMEQALPEMIRESLRDRGSRTQVVHPPLSLDAGMGSPRLLRQLFRAARTLGAARERVPVAAYRAARAQRRYERELAAVGRRTLAYGSEHGVPVVAVLGSLHVLHDRGVNASVPHILRDNGVLALPMDCYPIPNSVHPMPRAVWAEANRVLRTAAAARERGDVYPLLLTAFGCGPSSFVEQVFTRLMAGYPHTVLESDGHGGAAGYITRVQAFLHPVRQHTRQPAPIPREWLRLVEPLRERPIGEERDARIVIFSVADRLSPVMAAAYRAHGFDAVGSGPTDARTLATGRRDCSGKECLPYQLIWGAFRRHLEENPTKGHTMLVQVQGGHMCRNCMFTVKDQVSLERLGVGPEVTVRQLSQEPDLGWSFLWRLWGGVVTWDLLYQLSSYHRPLERGDGEVDRMYHRFCDQLEALLARPVRRGAPQGLDVARDHPKLLDLVDRASRAYADLAAASPPNGHRTVLLSGDIYLRVDEFASDSLVRRLNARGMQVVVEPTSVLAEYMAFERMGDLFGLTTARVDNAVLKRAMKLLRRHLYNRARVLHPWLPTYDIAPILRAGARLLDRYPRGEAPVTIGSVLHHWEQGFCDGVVVVSPWGCAPALVSESLLRHQRDIPLLFVYGDGSPIDDRRLNAFAFGLRRRAPRVEIR
jgi:activator of 2-hydroxyglutaryl-CoA dehydratase/predicted nucleotide-binding protein (sugar kinase/HSP70/actin superfamily)